MLGDIEPGGMSRYVYPYYPHELLFVSAGCLGDADCWNVIWWTANRLLRQDLGFTDWNEAWIFWSNTASNFAVASQSWLPSIHIDMNLYNIRGIAFFGAVQYRRRGFLKLCLPTEEPLTALFGSDNWGPAFSLWLPASPVYVFPLWLYTLIAFQNTPATPNIEVGFDIYFLLS